MTIQAFRIENFMAFEDTGWIELRPITLLFGRNSSGKSAIIRALRLLKQSLYALPGEEPLVFVAEEALDQGSFLETVHHQRVEQTMLFHFRCRLGKSLDGLGEVPLWESISLSLGFRWDKESRRIFLSVVRVDCLDATNHQACLFAAEKLTNDKWNLTSEMLDQEALRHDLALWSKVILSLSQGFVPAPAGQVINQDELVAVEEFLLVQRLMAELQEGVSEFLNSMEYLGPIRPEPQRIYTLDRLFGQRLLKRGLSAWLDFLGDEVGQEKIGEINRWVQHLGLGEEIELEKTELKRTPVTISALRVYEALARPSINLSDMGFGASQVLPVIALSVLAKEGSFVMIEQPELHLHPRGQAQMADLFIDGIAVKQDEAKEDEEKRPPRFLLETHSEYLLLRLRRRIAETSNRTHKNSTDPNLFLRPDDLAVYFVHRVDGISSVEEIKISDYGEFLNIPQGFDDFFSDDLIETGKLAQERLKAGLMWRKPSHDSSN